MIVKRGEKSLGIGSAGRNVTITVNVTKLVNAFAEKPFEALRYVHKMSPRKARLYAEKMLHLCDTLEKEFGNG